MSKTDFAALLKWNKMPKDIQKRILDNVFCSNCYVTTIVDYTMSDEEHEIVIKGKCKKCGKDIAHVVECDK
jgi:hypothetical protein